MPSVGDLVMKRAKKLITYHGRAGHPLIHIAKAGRRFIMVRKQGGGVKRLYEGSKYRVNRIGKRMKRLILR